MTLRENPSEDESAVETGSRGLFDRLPPKGTGFRHWLLENYHLIYGLDLVCAYASLMLYLASLVLIGRPSVVSKTFLGILIGTATIALLPFAAKRYGDPDAAFRRVLRTRRPRQTERVEIIIAVVLWSLIAIVILAAILFSHGRDLR